MKLTDFTSEQLKIMRNGVMVLKEVSTGALGHLEQLILKLPEDNRLFDKYHEVRKEDSEINTILCAIDNAQNVRRTMDIIDGN